MLEKIKKKLFGDGGAEDPSRRKFIRDAAGLAALTVAATQCPSLLKEKTLSLEEKIRSGIILNEIFYLTEPIVLDMPDITISNCKFVAMADMDHMIKIGPNAERAHITYNIFAPNGFSVGGVS